MSTPMSLLLLEGCEVMANRRKLTQTERRTIYDKMGGHCAYCGEELAFEDMQVDHVLALRSMVRTIWRICYRPVVAATTINVATLWRVGERY